MDKLDLILGQLQGMNDKITSVETNMATKDDIAEIDARLTNVETNMATKNDLAEIDARLTNVETNMATKNDLAEIDARLTNVETNMATKNDLAEIEARMATKDDLAQLEARMATKDDIAELPYIRQAVLENSRSLVLLTETVQQISQTLARIEIEHGRKLSALFDLYQLHTEQLNRIEDRLNIHEEIIFQR